MRADRRSPDPVHDAARTLVESGIIDADWVSAQLGTRFDSAEEAAEAVVDAGDVSPHPLFEASWLPRKKSWQRSGQHPVVWYVGERRRRNRLSPHPLVDPREIMQRHPEAREHEHGPLSYWISVAGPDTPLPSRGPHPQATWGEYRTAAMGVAQAWRDQAVRRRTPPVRARGAAPATAPGSPLVTVVLAAQDAGPLIRPTVATLQAQSFTGWELVAVDQGSLDDTAAVLTGIAAFDERVTIVKEGRIGPGRALNLGLEHATGEYVGFLEPGRAWTPDFLASIVGHLVEGDHPMAHAGAGPVARSRDELLNGRSVDLTTTVIRRDVLKDAGGFDEDLGAAVDRDLVLRLTRDDRTPLLPVDLPILRRPESVAPGLGDDWESVALERHLVDWDALAARRTRDDVVSVVLPIGTEPRRTIEWLLAVPPAGIELVAVGTRLRRAHHMLAAAMAAVVDGARFVSLSSDVNPNAAANYGISLATGSTVVVARSEAAPPRDTMALLAAALDAPGVAVVQPVVTDREGLILSAGASFTRGSHHPALLLAGHPVSDARRIGSCEIAAPASPVIALRTATAAALRGFDCRYRSVLAETDLGLRARATGEGSTRLVPEAVVTSRTSYGDPTDLIPALLILGRRDHPLPPDPTPDLLRTAGFEITDHRTQRVTVDPDNPSAPAVLVPRPVVRAVDGINESPPRLRWAIDIAAPAATRGDRWGDTHFARSLSKALERHGQHVSVDRREARHRATRDHDDVVLVLRGLDRVEPHPGVLNVEWVISHPDLITPEEIVGFDLVYAASLSWSAGVSRDWGIPVRPLLQCTDERYFHPGRGEPDSGPTVLFVGNSRGVYRHAVRSALAIGADLTLHGSDWAEFVDPARIASTAVANEDVGALYASAGVVLNDHHLDMRRASFASNRLFDAAACGARVVSDLIDGLEQTFHGLVLPFRDEADMARLLTPPYDAFPDNATRRELAHRIVQEHTFDKRAETLVGDAVRALRDQGR